MYDAAIIGAGPSGLTAAARLAHFGVKVCLIEAHTRLGGLNSWHHVKGLEVSSGLHAFTNYTTGGRGGALGKLLRQLRIRFDDLELYPQGVSSIRFPSATLRFTNDPEFFRQQVAETFPNDIAGFDRLRLAVTSTDEGEFTTRQTSARAVLEEYIHNPLLVDMLFCPVMFYGNPGGVGDGMDKTRSKPDMDWLLFCVVWKCIFETGLACPAGGMRGIWEQLAARFADNGGELITGVGVRELTTTADEKKVRTLVLTDGREIEARTVFSSAGMQETARLLGDDEIRLDDSPISIVEGVSILDQPSTSAGLEDTTVFYSLEDVFAFARPQGLTDRRSGVLCAMDNYLLPEEKKKPVLKATCLASYPAWRSLEIVKEDKPFANLFPEEEKKIVLHPEQQAAVDKIGAALDDGRFQSFLLHGATGSGKTEVYMRLIAKTLEMGKGALVLVPEVSLTPQTVSRFRKRFGNIAVLHYKLGEGERAEHWRRLSSGQVRLAVGARSAVFAPVRDLGLIVVDEEHEKSYKQDNDPRYNARDIALVRASITNACAILGSATPSLESWQNAHIGKHSLVRMPTRAGGARTPTVKVVDLRQEWADVKQPVLFSRELERELEQCLKRKEQAILFLNRRGFHTIIRCPACGDSVECDHCDIAMTHHRSQNLLRCGYCGFEKRVPDVCPTCGSATLRFGGVGTERIEDILAGIFPKARLLRMDSDSMSAKDSHAEALVSFSRGDYDILLGTQMVAKGLDFPNVTLVGVLMADGALGMSDFRAPERTFQLVTQVIGRAGRSDKAGKAVVQAFQPDHHAVKFAIAQDYQSFVDAEIPDRLRRGYPPFGRLARVVVSGKDSKQVVEKARRLGDACKRTAPEKGRLLGPAACEVERVQGVFRWHMIFFAPEYKTLAAWLAAAEVKPGEEKNVRVIIDVDPASMQ